MVTHCNLGMEVLFHTTQDMKDLYFHFMKPRGMLDYICYFLNEFEYEEGIRLDITGIYPYTIVEKYIRLENQLKILGKIQALRG